MSDETILVVDDDKRQCKMLENILKLEGYRVYSSDSANTALEIIAEGSIDIVISDLKMPELSGIELYEQAKTRIKDIIFIIITAYGDIESAIAATKSGIYDYLVKPVDAGQLLHRIQQALEVRKLKQENIALKETKKFIGNSPQIREVLESVQQVAPSDATVLIYGETGSGKELIANLIHTHSSRAGRPFVRVNCAAIPEGLLENELFGHEKGAYTGAHSERIGRFEAANHGTLFLDEIADLPLHLQVSLLRILQEREFERLGSSKTIPVDIRLIAATNRNLRQLVKEGEFREDLFYRINVVPIIVPPLRERKDDIILLANYFLNQFSAKNMKAYKGISKAAERKLLDYNWPGNVRELQNCIERAVVMARSDEIQPQDISLEHSAIESDSNNLIGCLFKGELTLDELEKELLVEALERSGWNTSRAARLLGLTRRTLQYRIEKYSISKQEGT